MYCNVKRIVKDVSEDGLRMAEWKFSTCDIVEDGPEGNKLKLVWWLDSYRVFERATTRHKFKIPVWDIPQYVRLGGRSYGGHYTKEAPVVPDKIWSFLNKNTPVRNELFVE